jgi:Ca2+-transporting ATPase
MSRAASPLLPQKSATPPPTTVPHLLNPENVPTVRSETAEYSLLTPEQTAERLRTNITRGLSPTEVNARLITYGRNELPSEEPEPLWMRFLNQFKETLILLLLGSAAVSLIMGNLDDAISITVAVVIVVSVGFVQEYRSEKSLEKLHALVPHFAHVIRNESTDEASSVTVNGSVELKALDTASGLEEAESLSSTIAAADLVPGDLVLLHTGDRVPADIRITHAAELAIDESNLTGENEPVEKNPKRLHHLTHPETSLYASPATGVVGADVRLNDQHNIAFMGTLVRSGYAQGIVIGTGGKTEFGAISASLGEIESPRTPLQLSMDKLGKDLSYMSFGIIGFILLVGLLRGWAIIEMFQIGVSLAVAAIPEGLPIIVTVTLALGVLRMSNVGAIVRRLPSVETLGSVNVICTDKTGTLTTNHMTVTKLWHFGEAKPIEVARKQGTTNLDAATKTILRIGNIVNHSRLSGGDSSSSTSIASVLSSTIGDDPSLAKSRWIGQPTDVALLDLIDAFDETDVRNRIGTRLYETPFSSERKWMGVIIKASDSDKDVAYIKGALEQVISKCDTYITADGRQVVLDEARRTEVTTAADAMAVQGLRVLAFASGSVQTKLHNSEPEEPSKEEHKYQGLAFAGLVGMNDPPRKGVDRSIRRLMAGRVRVIMVTGDSETTAVAIGKQLGLPIMDSSLGRSVMRGDQIDQMSEQDLMQALSTVTVFARTSPEHKLKIVRALQAKGDVCAMTGDGVNDAPALKRADIGISMGRTGTDVAKEAADMILTDDDFSTILNAIEEGKGIFYNIQNFLTFQLSTSAAALSLVLLSTIFGFKNPLNAMQILWISQSPLSFPSSSSLICNRYPHGWTTCPIPWSRASRSSRDVQTSSPKKRTCSHTSSHPTCPPICLRYHARHPLRVHPRTLRRRRSYPARYHHDIYLLRSI